MKGGFHLPPLILYPVNDKISYYATSLSDSSSRKFVKVAREILKTYKVISQCYMDISLPDTISRICEPYAKLNGLLFQEEAHWRQRSRADWIKVGDKNTTYFHNKATNRRKKTEIASIVDSLGWRQDTLSGISTAFQSFYSNLFTSSNPTMSDLEEDVVVLASI